MTDEAPRDEDLATALAGHGLLLLGHGGRRALIGNAGPAMWRAFERDRGPPDRSDPRGGRDPLDRWTRAVVDPLAERFRAAVRYPFDRPFPPILTWAREMGVAFPSPMGLFVHPLHGPWHAYRAALEWAVAPPPEAGLAAGGSPRGASPCEACAGRPCLQACPAGAIMADGVDANACRSHVADGTRCAAIGCLARHACPVGQASRYDPAQAAFHMRAFAGP